MNKILCILLTLFFTPAVQAQHSAYMGEVQPTIKSLSEKEIAQYMTGAGMGLAKAAELNHFPGPKHVLDLADTLRISAGQKKQLENIFNEMRDAAIAVGRQIIEKEKILSTMFQNGTMTLPQLEQLTKDIGELQAKLRFVHLRTHIATKNLMTQHQVRLYDLLRGYASIRVHEH